MSGYFQKINGRSAESIGDTIFHGILLQPENQSTKRLDEDQLMGSDEPRTIDSVTPGSNTEATTSGFNSINDLPDVIHQHHFSPTTIENKNIIQPVIERIKELNADNSKKKTEIPGEEPKSFTSIIEKIHERNFDHSHYLTVDHLTEKTSLETNTIKITAPVRRTVDSDENRNESKKSTGSEKQRIIPTHEKDRVRFMVVEKTKEILVPKESAAPDLQPVKNVAAPKLIIGKITVEVIRQIQPAVKTKEPQMINQSYSNPDPMPEFRGVDKLHFGLGQL